MKIPEQTAEIDADPELLDLFVQTVSVLSNVATLVTTWKVFSDRDRPRTITLSHPNPQTEHIEKELHLLRRQLEDCFADVDRALRILQEGIPPKESKISLMDAKPRFGRGVFLSSEQFVRFQMAMQSFENAALHARTHMRNIQNYLVQTTMQVPEVDILDADEFNAGLNSVLFESDTFEEASLKLRELQIRAEDYTREMYRSLRRN